MFHCWLPFLFANVLQKILQQPYFMAGLTDRFLFNSFMIHCYICHSSSLSCFFVFFLMMLLVQTKGHLNGNSLYPVIMRCQFHLGKALLPYSGICQVKILFSLRANGIMRWLFYGAITYFEAYWCSWFWPLV